MYQDNRFLGKQEKNNDIEFLCDGMLINFLSYYFKIEIIYIGTLVSMKDLVSTLRTSLCISYLSNNLKKIFTGHEFSCVIISNICVSSQFYDTFK